MLYLRLFSEETPVLTYEPILVMAGVNPRQAFTVREKVLVLHSAIVQARHVKSTDFSDFQRSVLHYSRPMLEYC